MSFKRGSTVAGIHRLGWTPWGPGEVSCIESVVSPNFISGVNLYQENIFGTYQSVPNAKVSLFEGCPLRGVLL